MRKNSIFLFILLLILAVSCKNDDENLFDKSAEERSSEAIAELKSELIRPANGWRVRYRPESGSGSFWVLMEFNDNNEVTIKSDLASNEGEFFEQTITYRIDSSLGLELIFESYSFFSFLFEQDQATFQAEYEFNFVNKTPDQALVFVSKTDFNDRTTLLFEEAGSADVALLGTGIATHLQKFPSSTRLVYTDKDLAVYLAMDGIRRTANFSYVSSKANVLNGQAVDLFTGFILQGDSIIFDNALDVNFNGNRVYLKSIRLTNALETTINICPEPTTSPQYEGFTSLNEKVLLETSLFDNNGASFKERAEIYAGPVFYIINQNGQSMGDQVGQDIVGALYFVVYNIPNGLKAMGFLIENPDGSTAIVVKQYTATYTGNIVEYTFAPTFTTFGTVHPRTNINNIDPYLELLTRGDKTYIYRLNQFFYEMYNPCSGWRFIVQIIE